MNSAIATGTRIGPYEIVGWLGAGGMGEVYRARDSRLGRDVALKLVPAAVAADGGRVRRFEQEARAAGQLNHPNILIVYDTGVHDGIPYLVSELLEGQTLRARLAAAAMSPRKAIDAAQQIAEGLAAAHDKGIVHRDVKPDNLFVTTDGRIKILDFGIAKLTTSGDDGGARTGLPTDTAAGTVVGTARYMSPEQVRGETVDARSDIFSLGIVLYEMLTGSPPFARDTAPETMSAILKDEAPELEAANVPPALARIVARCMEKTRERRFQSARDLAFGLDVLSGTHTSTAPVTAVARGRGRLLPVAAVVALVTAAGAGGWLAGHDAAPPASDNPLADATISRFTSWPGSEMGAEISPDGKFVAFVADRDGELDLFVSQVGTGIFHNRTADMPALMAPGALLRTFGFSADGSELWLTTDADAGGRKVLIPVSGGAPPRPFLRLGDAAPAWSPEGSLIAYLNNTPVDRLYLAGPRGADPRLLGKLLAAHNHNPIWSADGEWIYFVSGPEATADMDIWRIRPSGQSLERLTEQRTHVNYLAPLDSRTVLYVARARDRSGPWLWSLDVPTKVVRRLITGLDQYTHLSASRDGRRVVATAANQTTTLWSVPIGDRIMEDRDAVSYSVPMERALAPRFAGTSLMFLSARGTGDGLWRLDQSRQLSQIWNGADGPLSEPGAVSRDGSHVAVVVRQNGKRRLMVMAADGTSPRTLAPSIEIQGAAGQGAADWSPDGRSIVAGGIDDKGPALFSIPADGNGAPIRLVSEAAESPVWSPDGGLILYSGPFAAGQVDLRAVKPDGTRVAVGPRRLRPGAYRFLSDSRRVVYLEALPSLDFMLLDLATGSTRRLTRLGNQGALRTFDITPDGKQIVFDRSRDNSDILLFDLPKPGGNPPGR